MRKPRDDSSDNRDTSNFLREQLLEWVFVVALTLFIVGGTVFLIAYSIIWAISPK